MSYQVEFTEKGKDSWMPWAKKYPTLEALKDDWGGEVLNTDEFEFRIAQLLGEN